VIQIENQARVCHSSTVVGLGTSFGRGASSTLPGDLQNSDLIVLEGSNMAEAHPVAYQWVVEAKARGATVVHVDPHYSRTSTLAGKISPLHDFVVQRRAGLLAGGSRAAGAWMSCVLDMT